ncbi:NTP pyrophosphatase, house-cleaning of non-canonical NTPs [Pilibacter termitis]|uniref:NTP pyrophosphatase, house-cleaning of non-canonical NTPs n=1 Tax=Pilibacter termitis TaxID=263852 RepID=A0A1T4N1R8_9ENTE|nr:nucleotide pyrophosphohydrolase [Pilibacter termitis]SJZ73054.1 NTP pyrophosphatase, house-cleaning of non-canonical NTPs [Pilibacter termitis]
MKDFSNFQEKTLKEMQVELDDYIAQFKKGYFPPMSQMVRMSEEVGELSREVMHVYGEKQKKENEPNGSISEELGDVLVVVMLLANSLNIDLTDTFEKNMEKFYKRDTYRFERVDEETSAFENE